MPANENSIIQQFLDTVARIEQKALDLMGLISLADSMVKAGQMRLASLLYKYWLLSNPEHPLRYAAAFNCGSQLVGQGDLEGAQTLLREAVEANPDFHPARLNLGMVYERMNDAEGALTVFREVVERLSVVNRANIGSKVQALRNIARLRRATTEAETALKEGFEIDPTQTELAQHWINTRQSRCVWPVLEPLGPLAVDDLKRLMAPLSISMYEDDPELHLQVARAYVGQALRGENILTTGSWPPPANAKRRKLRVGYMSSDLCNHAIGYLMTDIFGYHNRERFEIVVYNIGERNNDPLQQKVLGKVDRWADIKDLPDKAAAATIIRDEIDILLDINGHTNYQRTRLLSMKPAPIIANWLGYPGTIGSDFHDYIIADDFIIPPAHELYYSERVLRLPCYQPNGALSAVPEPKKSRTELGLPETGVVFCCFNGGVKITPPVFSRWMTILKQVPDSVLWLRGSGDDAPVQLRKEAEQAGVSPDRLVFLPFQSNTEYLACHRYADVFLDTFPYGAHTTASDSLRTGIPIVTLAGQGFASRVCGSLSRSAGLPEMVCETPEQYVALAIELGNDKEKLKQVKSRLAAALPNCNLFNSRLLVERLESLFEQMWSDYCKGKLFRRMQA